MTLLFQLRICCKEINIADKFNMPQCLALNCKNHSTRNKKSGITFHRLPRDQARLSEWLVNLQRIDFKPSVASRVCSEHFTVDCFDRTGSRVLLSKLAVPTIFIEEPTRVIIHSIKL